MIFWLVVSTHLKNISQIGSFPQAGVKISNIWVATTQFCMYQREGKTWIVNPWPSKSGWCYCAAVRRHIRSLNEKTAGQRSRLNGGKDSDLFWFGSDTLRILQNVTGSQKQAAGARNVWRVWSRYCTPFHPKLRVIGFTIGALHGTTCTTCFGDFESCASKATPSSMSWPWG